MSIRLSPPTIEILAQIISGGRGPTFLSPDPEPTFGVYRSANDIAQFLRGCRVSFRLDGSRLPSLISCLTELNDSNENDDKIRCVVESAVDRRTFVTCPEKLYHAVSHLARFLKDDGFDLQERSGRYRLCEAAQRGAIVGNLSSKAEVLSLDTVNRDLERALANVIDDPEDAVTSACSTVESVCRSVLVEMKVPLPQKKDLSGLYRAVRGVLGLAPERSDLPAEIADDVRKILSGLITSLEGIGALRTHAGDAHGRERGYRRIDARIARLAIHAASTIALFVIETWERQRPGVNLKRH